MPHTVDYYFAPISPWAYLGHDRFVQMADAAGAQVRVLPVDFGQVFPASGGLPLAKRAPQRQAYRLLELQRFAEWLGKPMHLQPQHFPVPGDDAGRLITAVAHADGSAAALRLSGAVFAAVWAGQRDISNAATLAELLAETGLPAARLEQSRQADVDALYQRHTRQAIDAGIFGSPTYVVDGEMFWGQDRLDFVQRKLQR